MHCERSVAAVTRHSQLCINQHCVLRIKTEIAVQGFLADGFGFATIDPASIQADYGARLLRPFYSGNANCPLTRKVPVTTVAPVWGCPPPTERV